MQVARPQVPHAGLLGVVFAGEAKAAGHAGLIAILAKRRVIRRAHHGAAAVDQIAHRTQPVGQEVITRAGGVDLRQRAGAVEIALVAVIDQQRQFRHAIPEQVLRRAADGGADPHAHSVVGIVDRLAVYGGAGQAVGPVPGVAVSAGSNQVAVGVVAVPRRPIGEQLTSIIIAVICRYSVERLREPITVCIITVSRRVTIGIGSVGQAVEDIKRVTHGARIARHRRAVAISIECIVGKEQITARSVVADVGQPSGIVIAIAAVDAIAAIQTG